MSRSALLADELNYVQATEVVTGGCRGIDADAEKLARRFFLKVTTFKADWKKHGRKAGPMRNQEIADYADMLVAFPGGKGTSDMISRMKKLGKPVVQYK